MSHQLTKKFVLLSSLLSFMGLTACATVNDFFSTQGDGKVVATSNERSCHLLTPENQLQNVTACQTATNFEFQIVERRLTYEKIAMRSLLKERLLQFVKRTAYPWQSLELAQIQLWMVAPVFRPENAYFVAVVLSPAGNFVARLPLETEQWLVAGSRVQLLGKDIYPTLKANRAGLLVLQAHDHVSTTRIKSYLAAAQIQISDAALATAPVLQIETPVFGEAETARRLLSQDRSKQIIRGLSYLPAGGEEGARALIDSFSFKETGF